LFASGSDTQTPLSRQTAVKKRCQKKNTYPGLHPPFPLSPSIVFLETLPPLLRGTWSLGYVSLVLGFVNLCFVRFGGVRFRWVDCYLPFVFNTLHCFAGLANCTRRIGTRGVNWRELLSHLRPAARRRRAGLTQQRNRKRVFKRNLVSRRSPQCWTFQNLQHMSG